MHNQAFSEINYDFTEILVGCKFLRYLWATQTISIFKWVVARLINSIPSVADCFEELFEALPWNLHKFCGFRLREGVFAVL